MDYVYDDFVPGEWELPIKPEVKYGMVMYKDCAAVRPDMGNQGIMQYMLVDFNDRLGYRMAYGIATNPITIGLNNRAPSTRHLATSIVDVSTIVFPNGLMLADCMNELVSILPAPLSRHAVSSLPDMNPDGKAAVDETVRGFLARASVSHGNGALVRKELAPHVEGSETGAHVPRALPQSLPGRGC